MYCKHCGTQIEENAKFCPICGKIVEDSALNSNQEPKADYFDTPNFAPNYYDDSQIRQPDKPAGVSSLVFAILGLEFISLFFSSFLGLIFSYVARSKVDTYARMYGELNGVNKVAKILSKVGIIVGWVLTGLLIVYIIALASML